jgi:hypothetical protein
MVDKAALRQFFSGFFSFPYQAFYPHHHPSSRGLYNRPISGHSNTGLGSTPLQEEEGTFLLSFPATFPIPLIIFSFPFSSLFFF